MSEAESYDSCAVFCQQQQEAADKFESVTSLPTGNGTVPSATGSPGAEEPTAMEGTSASGPTIYSNKK